MYALLSRMVGVADDAVRFRDIASLVSAPGEGLADRIRCHSLLEFRAKRSGQFLAQLVREVLPRRRGHSSFGRRSTHNAQISRGGPPLTHHGLKPGIGTVAYATHLQSSATFVMSDSPSLSSAAWGGSAFLAPAKYLMPMSIRVEDNLRIPSASGCGVP